MEEAKIFVLRLSSQERAPHETLDRRCFLAKLIHHRAHPPFVHSISPAERNEIRQRIIAQRLEGRRHEIRIPKQRQSHERQIVRIMQRRTEQIVGRCHHIVAKRTFVNRKILQVSVPVPEQVIEKDLPENPRQFHARRRTHRPDDEPSRNFAKIPASRFRTETTTLFMHPPALSAQPSAPSPRHP